MDIHSMKQHAGHLSLKLLFAIAVAAFIVLGIIGLVLPIVPGLLFLAIAAIMLAPHIPALNTWMRRSPLMSRYIEDAENLRTLAIVDQIRLGALLSLRMLIDGARYALRLLRGLFNDVTERQAKRTGARRGSFDQHIC